MPGYIPVLLHSGPACISQGSQAPPLLGLLRYLVMPKLFISAGAIISCVGSRPLETHSLLDGEESGMGDQARIPGVPGEHGQECYKIKCIRCICKERLFAKALSIPVSRRLSLRTASALTTLAEQQYEGGLVQQHSRPHSQRHKATQEPEKTKL